jgi:hypothetical protein
MAPRTTTEGGDPIIEHSRDTNGVGPHRPIRPEPSMIASPGNLVGSA